MKTNPFHTLVLALFIQTPFVAAADFDVKNETEVRKILPAASRVEKLAGNLQFTEGPVWTPMDGGCLIFSDIPANELKKWSPAGGLTTFRNPCGNANGNTLDLQDRLVTAEHSGRRVSVIDKTGAVHPLCETFNGRKFNSPNDVVVKSDGTVWFTDPPYGLPQGEAKEQEGNYVYRFEPGTQRVTAVVKDFDMPNGLCFSPDEKRLYIADSGKPRHIRVFEVNRDGTLAGGRVFCQIDQGGPDGIRCDADGRVWSSSGNGVQVFAPDGSLILKINLPESGANLCFGGKDGKTLFITARKSLYALPTLVGGALRP
ncbi:MAG TPA: SMP-30/gluconolactonase/LRE family protein [Candidatus Paceibacterota bacterium]|nr:SMP-30/gluconolactonase/LRE family protein [Verrucomicrobiota bacterium]HRY48521.1 SMP-30/gluconolactonase/LRE family protein [Candidatus Paceibacterota bacterium]HSA00533.1 SMP-30/gluconolactonase/LRE family protein [Candidatus Paceibacterota bacterium]